MMTSREVLQALQSEKISIEDAKRALITRENPIDTDTGTNQAPALDKLNVASDPGAVGIVGSFDPERGDDPVPCANPVPTVPAQQSPLTQPSGKLALPASDTGGKEAIAIIGMSGRYPDARNLAEYWENLVQGKNAIREIPPSRFNVSDYYDPDPGQRGKIYCKWLGALDEIACFDPLFFALSPAEAEAMDPQHRLFLEEGYKAFEDAGYSPGLLSNSKCGVYLGIMNHEYDLLMYLHKAADINILGGSSAIAAARIAYLLNLKGPTIPIDTACSSSLVATHLACQALSNQEIDMALVGGVSLYLLPDSYVGMCSAGMLSPDGQCKTFDASANGFVPGEGVGTLVLKRLADAEADHDQIYGVIIGSGINQDGKTNGITAPSVKSQTDLVQEIYEKYQVDPESISYVEMHGTGTKLGDPIELEALATVFQEKTPRKQYCAIGSVKTNIGHTSAAAGVASLQKVLLAMKQKKLVPTLNFQQPNPHFDFEDSPFYVNTSLQDWNAEAGTALRAAVSSFGFSGTNAHVVIEEYIPAPSRGLEDGDLDTSPDRGQPYSPRLAPGACLFVLSAKSEQQLASYAQEMKRWIQEHTELALVDIAFTLQLGRDAMEYRLAIEADSREVLLQRLERFVNKQTSPGLYVTQVKKENNDATLFESDEDGRSLLHIWCQKKNLAKIAQIWVKGVNVDWKLLCGSAQGTIPTGSGQAQGTVPTDLLALPHRVSLPTYPFARERYWIPIEAIGNVGSGASPNPCACPPVAIGQAQAAVPTYPMHPLVQHNVSDFFAMRFSSTFRGDEFFLADHVVKGQRIMPGVVYLEMARAAVAQAMRIPGASAGFVEDGSILRLSQIVWARPLVVSASPVTVHITLSPQENRTISFVVSEAAVNEKVAFVDSNDAVTGTNLGREETSRLSIHLPNECIDDESPVPYAQGTVELHIQDTIQNLDLPAIQSRCQRQISASECYQRYRELSISYGPSMQGIEQLRVGEGELLARLRLSAGAQAYTQESTPLPYVLHPSMLDAALHACIGLLIEQNRSHRLYLPFALEELLIMGTVPTQGWAWCRRRDAGSVPGVHPVVPGIDSATGLVFDIEVCDDEGRVVLCLRGFRTRMLPPGDALSNQQDAGASTAGILRLAPRWEPIILSRQAVAPGAPANLVVIVGGTPEEQSAIAHVHPHACPLEISISTSIERLVQRLQELGTIEEVFWLAPHDSLLALSQESILAAQQQGVLACFRLIKALLQLGYGDKTLRWTVITRQARTLHVAEIGNPAHASLLGLFGSLAKEYSHWCIQQVDLLANVPLPLTEMQRLPADSQGHGWLYRDGHWYRQILVPLNVSSFEKRETYRKGGVYVVIGGAGGIGEVWSEALIHRYQAQVIWIGRRRIDAGILAKQERLAALGPRPYYITADATNRSALQQTYQQIKQKFGQIHGVIHSAIVLQDQSLAKMDEERFQAALAAKVEVSVRLVQVFEREPLDFVLFFSSLNAFTRNAGQSNYAAGCTFEDAFAARLGQDWPCVVKVMNWSYWGSVGAVASSEYRERMGQIGVGSIEPAEAMETLEELLAGPVDQMVVLKTTEPVFLHATSNGASSLALPEVGQQVIMVESDGVVRQLRFLLPDRREETPSDRSESWGPVGTGASPVPTAPDSTLHSPRISIGDEELREKSIAYLKEQVGKVLNLPSTRIDAAEPLTKYGLDSLLVLQLTNALRTDMEQISSTLFFEYPTIDALVEHFLKTQKEALEHLVGIRMPAKQKDMQALAPPRLAQPNARVPLQETPGALRRFLTEKQVNGKRDAEGDTRGREQTNAPTAPIAPSTGRDIAIIGLAGRYPGAKDVQAFWDLLSAGKSAIREIPPERWDWRDYFQAKKGATQSMYTKWGGFLEDIESFDAPFFHVSPHEAEQMDPQERLFLEASYTCIEDAGYTPAGLQEGGQVGVFVGVMNGNYPTGATYWSIANRVSSTLGLQGPSVAVDTACSSSLTALHFAVESLISGTSASAIVGGVNLIVDPVHYVRLSHVGMLSASDQCKSFGEDADGFVDGEGVGAILLKPRLQAEADGDHIYGVIKATAINHGGKTNGYTVPSPQAQAKVIEQALQRGAIDPRTISYVEAHGTGTVLGDPIEIAGLARAFEACGVTDKQYCAIGSVKSNIGHTESAAGIAGITKVLLQMHYGQLVPSLHAEVLNPHIDFSATPFIVQRELSSWKRPQLPNDRRDTDRGKPCPYGPCPRRAGVSSFGAGGSNAHVILEEYVGRNQQSGSVGEGLVPTLACDSPDPDNRAYSNEGVQRTPLRPALIVLSARTEGQLRERVQQLLTWIREKKSVEEQPVGQAQDRREARSLLDNLAYTLQVGREAMGERLALQVDSLAELEEKLGRYICDSMHEEGDWYRGHVKKNDPIGAFAADEDGQQTVAAWMNKGKYEKLLAFWAKGLTVDWKLLYSVETGQAQGTRTGASPVPTTPTRVRFPTPTTYALPHRISLPTYPFARQRYWIPAVTARTCRNCGLSPDRHEDGGVQDPSLQSLRSYLQPTTGSLAAPEELTQEGEMVAVYPDLLPTIPLGQYLFSTGEQSHLMQDPRRAQALAETREGMQEMEELLTKLFWSHLQSLGLFREKHAMPTHQREMAGISANYDRWLQGSLVILEQKQYLSGYSTSVADEHATCTVVDPTLIESEPLWQRWEECKEHWMQNDNLKAWVVLTETALRALPAILTGKRPATEILFPNGSMQLVEGIYRYNVIADSFNEVLAQLLVTYLQERLILDRDTRIRILEIGAGTGGTTNRVLQMIQPYQESIAEYCYSDISPAFLRYGQERYGEEHPYLTTQIFDVEKPLAGQGIEPEGYDVVIAANVLHATSNIRHTIRNAKAALKKRGLLLLNEISDTSLFLHLTFGLLSGWWAYEDPELRVSGSPALTKENWEAVLSSEGFGPIAFATPEQEVGQLVIAAVAGVPHATGGIVRQARQQQPAKAETARAPVSSPLVPVEKCMNPEDDRGSPPQPLQISLNKLREALLHNVADLLNVPLEEIDTETPLPDYGLDSITSMEFANRLNQAYQLELTPPLFYEHSTIERLALYLQSTYTHVLAPHFTEAQPHMMTRQDLASVAPKPVPEATDKIPLDVPLPRKRSRLAHSSESPTPTTASPVAIIGMSGIFPQAPDIQSFWRNLLVGRDCISEIPQERWDWQTYFGNPVTEGNKTNIKLAGVIEEVEMFDPLFFGISQAEAEQMDPQQRLLMMYVWKAIEDAGYAASSLSGTNTALFVGTTSSGYSERVFRANMTIGGHTSTGMISSVGPNRMSHFLNLHGPSEPIETACSSSLVAIHRGVNAIESGQCGMAIVGGVNTLVSPEVHISFSRAGMLSPDGRCKAFGASANGYVRGEGVGMLVLKRLDLAEQDGDHIYAVIRAIAENHGGRSSSLTAPNPRAQADLLVAAYRKAGIDPRTVGYIETHGTGTPLGDPIEINGLKTAWSELAQRTGTRHSPYGEEDARRSPYGEEDAKPQAWCGIGSVKSNIGHLELASGVASVIKVVLQLQHKQLVKSLHCEQINPYIELKGSPFYIVQETREWGVQRNQDNYPLPRRAGVSAFGFGGVNAHVILEEYVPKPQTILPKSEASPNAIILLSAKNEERLHEQVQRLLAWIQERKSAEESLGQTQDQSLAQDGHEALDWREAQSLLDNVAYTLQVGREAMEERLALQVSSFTELQEKLLRYLQEPQKAGDWYRGQVKRYKETVALLSTDEELQEAIGKWHQRGKYEKLLEWWAKGLRIDWQLLYTVGAQTGTVGTGSAQGTIPTAPVRVPSIPPTLPHRVSLPTYPFARERYWISTPTIGTHSSTDRGEPLSLRSLPSCACPPTESLSGLSSRVLAHEEETRTVLLLPSWKEEMVSMHQPRATTESLAPVASNLLVLLCDLPDNLASRIQAQMISGGRCRSLPVGKGLAPFQQLRREERFREAVVQLIQELQHLHQSRPVQPALVQVVVAHRQEPSLLEALSGVLKVAQQEYPKLRGQLIEVDGEPEEEELLVWLRESQLRPHEPHIRYRDGKRWVRQWQEHPEMSAPVSIPWKEGGCYLISGGAGGLARLFVQEIARHVQEATIILVGRSALSDERRTQLDPGLAPRAEGSGIHIDYQQVDVSDERAVHALIQRVQEQYGHLNGIIHAAGVIHNTKMHDKTAEEVQAVLAPKVIGVELLDEASSEHPLDFFLLCSSLSAVLGGTGLVDYATANAYLDAFAHVRRAQVMTGQRQGETVSINWPYWEDGGIIQLDASAIQMMRELLGQEPMGIETGMKTFYQALTSGQAQVIVLHGQVERIKQQLLLRPEPPIEAGRNKPQPLHVEGVTSPDTSSAANGEGEQEPHTVSTDTLRETLTHMIFDLLKVQVEQIDAETPLSEYGFDSITFTQFVNRLNQAYQLDLTPALFFEQSTLSRLAQHLQANYAAILAPHFAVASPAASKPDKGQTGASPIRLYPPQGISRSPLPLGMEQNGALLAVSHTLQVGHEAIEERLTLLERDVPKPTFHRTDTYSIILAPNPSLLTGAGTRTIILGDQSTGAVVIDPATDDPEYLSDIIQEGQRYGGIRRILITHGHPDHVGGAEALRSQLSVPLLAFSNKNVPCADEEIADNTLFPIGDDMLRAIYTPGHSFDHLCFWLEKQRILFAGDLVTSSGPSLISPPPEGDLQDYMHSLELVQNLACVKIIPAHGEAILRPQEMLAECLTRCQKRKEQILAVVRATPQGIDIKTIVHALYKDVDASLYDFMASSILANLSILEREGQVKRLENKQVEQTDYWICEKRTS